MKTKTCDCGAEFVFLPTAIGAVLPGMPQRSRYVPVDVDSLTETDVELLNQRDEVTFRKDEHVAHFSTCPDADRHRRRP